MWVPGSMMHLLAALALINQSFEQELPRPTQTPLQV